MNSNGGNWDDVHRPKVLDVGIIGSINNSVHHNNFLAYYQVDVGRGGRISISVCRCNECFEVFSAKSFLMENDSEYIWITCIGCLIRKINNG